MPKKVMMMPKMACEDCQGCCLSPCGFFHALGGAGIAFLIVEYLKLDNLMLWGWLLVAISLIWHLKAKMKM